MLQPNSFSSVLTTERSVNQTRPELCIRPRRFAAIGLLCCLAVAALGAEPQPRASLRTGVEFGQHLMRNYGSDEGLPSNWINDVLQTRDSFIWIGTDNGLVRYDGARFKLISDEATLQSPSSEIRVLFEGRDGTLWVGTTGGLYSYRSSSPTTYQAIDAISDVPVFAIWEGADRVWVGTNRHTYVARQDADFEAVAGAPKNVRAICEADGSIWFGTGAGLFRSRDDEYEQIVHDRLPNRSSVSSGVAQTRVNALFVDDSDDLWIGTNRTLLQFRDGEFTKRGAESDIEAQQVYDFLQTKDGEVYVAARFGVYRAVDDSPFVQVSSTVSALCMMEDQLGRFWVGHGDNRGLNRYQNRLEQTFWSGARVRCVYQNDDGHLWFGSSLGAHAIRDGEIHDLTVEDGLPDRRVTTMIGSRDDAIWIGTARGLARCESSSLVPSKCAALTAGMNIGCGLEDSSGRLWFAIVSNRAYRCDGDSLVELQSLSRGRTHWFSEDHLGHVWIGHSSGLYREIDGEITSVSDPAIELLHDPRFQCHYEDPHGNLWLGTSNGILRYASNRFEAFPPSCGLLADNIERLAVDDEGHLWFGGRDGLFYVPIEELDAYANGSLPAVTSYRVAGFDRCPPVNAFSQGCLIRDGELWMVAENSLTRMPIKSAMQKAAPLSVLIDGVSIDGVTQTVRNDFSVLAGRKRMLFEYAVPEFEYREHVHTRYQLEGHDERWVSGDASLSAQYTDLRPGSYRFRVIARRGNGNWIESTDPIAFTVVPRWWELGWLRTLTICLLIAVGAGFSRYRLNRARRANAELRSEIEHRRRAEEESRENLEQLARVTRAASMGELSTSIAHEVKQPLFAIVSNAHTAKKLLDRDDPDVDEVRDALQDIASDGNRASAIIDRIRGMVKKEHQPTQRLDLNQVVLDAITFAAPEMRRQNLEVITELDPELPGVAGDAVELQQVVLNLLINGAQAMDKSSIRRIEVLTRDEGDDVQVSVRDHGVGIEEAKTSRLFEPFFTTKPEGTGMGLAINRTIIEAHRGRIWAEPNENAGMTFCFSLPVSNDPASPESIG